MSEFTQDTVQKPIDELVTWVKQYDFSLNLPTERLAFCSRLLCSVMKDLMKSSRRGSSRCIRDSQALVCRIGEAAAFRANNAINDRVKQRLLSRFSSEMTEGAIIYRLTPMAIGITDYYVRHREFSKLKLSIQLCMVADEMAKAALSAQQGGSVAHWRKTCLACSNIR